MCACCLWFACCRSCSQCAAVKHRLEVLVHVQYHAGVVAHVIVVVDAGCVWVCVISCTKKRVIGVLNFENTRTRVVRIACRSRSFVYLMCVVVEHTPPEVYGWAIVAERAVPPTEENETMKMPGSLPRNFSEGQPHTIKTQAPRGLTQRLCFGGGCSYGKRRTRPQEKALGPVWR